MSSKQVTCDDAALGAILRHDQSSDPSDELLAHVENCTRCQERLSELAGPTAMWHRVKDAIKPVIAFRHLYAAAGSRHFQMSIKACIREPDQGPVKLLIGVRINERSAVSFEALRKGQPQSLILDRRKRLTCHDLRDNHIEQHFPVLPRPGICLGTRGQTK